jgi:myb proto-oncogene protein
MQIGIMKEKLREAMPKLREAMPSPVQEFPWRNAQYTLLDRLLLLVQEALKWSLVVYFIFSTLSDVVYTFSINRELIIPVGLFVGVLMADFSKEISLELFRGSEV